MDELLRLGPAVDVAFDSILLLPNTGSWLSSSEKLSCSNDSSSSPVKARLRFADRELEQRVPFTRMSSTDGRES